VDPATVDYILAWAQQHRGRNESGLAYRDVTVPTDAPDLATYRAGQSPCLTDHAEPWHYSTWRMGADLDQTGQLLFDQNLRSIEVRYPDTVDKPENAPGPCDQSRIRRYAYRYPDALLELRPAWVIRVCECWRYQSCETDDHRDTAAWALVDAIREDAIRALVDTASPDAPWGIDADTLDKERAKRAAIRGKLKLAREA
jgi:hypothetical protein